MQKRSIRQYEYPYAAHVLVIGEVSDADIEEDDYYQPGDYIGKLGGRRLMRNNYAVRKEFRFFFVMPMGEFRVVIKTESLIKSLWQVRI